MSIYGELNPEPEHRTQFAFEGKREHIVKVNIPNFGYPNQYIDVEITYKDLYLSKQEREEKLLQGIQSGTGLKVRVGATKADGTALTVTTEENAINKTVSNRFLIPLDFDFFKHPTYPYGLREDLVVRLELNSPEKILLASADTAATYKISDIALEYDAIFNLDYATMFDIDVYRETLIPYTKVTAVHHQALSKKNENWKIDINNLSVRSLQGLLLLFVDKQNDFANENEKFYNPRLKRF